MKIIKKSTSKHMKRLAMCVGKNKKGGPKGMDTVWRDLDFFVTTDGRRLFATKCKELGSTFESLSPNLAYRLEYLLEGNGPPLASETGPHPNWRSIVTGNVKDIWAYHIEWTVPGYVLRLDKAKNTERSVGSIILRHSPNGRLVVTLGLGGEPSHESNAYRINLDLGLLAPYAGSSVHVYLPKETRLGSYRGPVLISEDALGDTVFDLDAFLLAVPSNTDTSEQEIIADFVDRGGQTMPFDFHAR